MECEYKQRDYLRVHGDSQGDSAVDSDVNDGKSEKLSNLEDT